MELEVLKKLEMSFNDLERAIEQAKFTIGVKTNLPVGIVERLDQYKDILAKQRILAKDIPMYINDNNFEEVGQIVKRVNALSLMIRDDARTILAEFKNEKQ